MKFRNFTKENFDWGAEDDLGGLIDPYPGSHPELDTELPVVLLEDDTPGPVSAVETKTLDPNAIATASSDNSGIINTKGFYDYSNAPTPIFTINPTPEMKPNGKHEGIEDYDYYNYYDDGDFE